MNAWSHLPNAHHIDWVLKSLKENPKLWSEVSKAARDATWDAVRGKARYTAWNEAWGGRAAAWDMAWAAVAAWDMARDAIAALVAYDDCDQYLQMTYEQLKIYAILSEKPQAVLLLPMKYVEERLNEQLKETI